MSSSTEHGKLPAQAGAANRAPGAALTRTIGRWSLTALIINSIIGSGIFGVPGVLMATTGRASPVVMLVAGLLMAVILFCYAEVGSQFSEAGGVYLYART